MKYFICALLLCSIQTIFGFPENKNDETQTINILQGLKLNMEKITDDMIGVSNSVKKNLQQIKNDTNIIQQLQLNVKKITDDFRDFSNSVKENLQQRFDNEENYVPEQMQILKNDILRNIEIDVLNEVHKEENLCYKIAKENIDRILKNSTYKARQCQFHELFYGYSPIYLNMNFTVKMGNDLVDNLESVHESCGYVEDEHLCQIKTKFGFDIIVDNIKSTISQLTKLANESSTSMLSKMQECTSNEIRTLKEKFQSIKNNAEGCFSFI